MTAMARGSWIEVAARSALAVLVLVACSSDSTSIEGAPGAQEVLGEQPGGAEPQLISFAEGSPATVYWDDARQTLFIADNDNNQIWKWDDASGLSKYATTLDPGGEVAAGGSQVGQLIELADGTLLVARFGKPGGGFGGIAWVRPDGSSGLVAGLEENLKRLGLTQAPDGTIYGTRFAPPPAMGMPPVGTVTRVELEGGETVLSEGFGKLIGLVTIGDTLYVSDQTAGVIYAAPLANLPARAEDYALFAQLPVPDQVCVGPDGSIFSGQFQGVPNSTDAIAIRQIHADGSVSKFIADPLVAKPSGVAYDPTQRRLFATDTGNVTQIGVHIFPVP